MRRLLAQPGVVSAAEVPWNGVLDRWPAVFPSFGDALLAAFAKAAGMDAVATFDRGFEKRLAKDGTASYRR
jgi:predicted nucleic acid-binding protein